MAMLQLQSPKHASPQCPNKEGGVISFSNCPAARDCRAYRSAQQFLAPWLDQKNRYLRRNVQTMRLGWGPEIESGTPKETGYSPLDTWPSKRCPRDLSLGRYPLRSPSHEFESVE